MPQNFLEELKNMGLSGILSNNLNQLQSGNDTYLKNLTQLDPRGSAATPVGAGGGGDSMFTMDNALGALQGLQGIMGIKTGLDNNKLGREMLNLNKAATIGGFNNQVNQVNSSMFDNQQAIQRSRDASTRLGGTVDPNALSPEEYLTRFQANKIQA